MRIRHTITRGGLAAFLALYPSYKRYKLDAAEREPAAGMSFDDCWFRFKFEAYTATTKLKKQENQSVWGVALGWVFRRAFCVGDFLWSPG